MRKNKNYLIYGKVYGTGDYHDKQNKPNLDKCCMLFVHAKCRIQKCVVKEPGEMDE